MSPLTIIKRAVWTLLILTGSVILGISLYCAFWVIVYRIPPSPLKTVDLRRVKTEPPYYLAFCSSLADNAFAGYPGHGYIVWSRKFPTIQNLDETESAGFVPRYVKDQIPSMFTQVPGLLVRDAWKGNLQNFTCLVAIVDQSDFEKTRQIRDSWKGDIFQVGVRDCVTFANGFATAIGLKTPNADYRYPQDYIRELKEKN